MHPDAKMEMPLRPSREEGATLAESAWPEYSAAALPGPRAKPALMLAAIHAQSRPGR